MVEENQENTESQELIEQEIMDEFNNLKDKLLNKYGIKTMLFTAVYNDTPLILHGEDPLDNTELAVFVASNMRKRILSKIDLR